MFLDHTALWLISIATFLGGKRGDADSSVWTRERDGIPCTATRMNINEGAEPSSFLSKALGQLNNEGKLEPAFGCLVRTTADVSNHLWLSGNRICAHRKLQGKNKISLPSAASTCRILIYFFKKIQVIIKTFNEFCCVSGSTLKTFVSPFPVGCSINIPVLSLSSKCTDRIQQLSRVIAVSMNQPEGPKVT